MKEFLRTCVAWYGQCRHAWNVTRTSACTFWDILSATPVSVVSLSGHQLQMEKLSQENSQRLFLANWHNFKHMVAVLDVFGSSSSTKTVLLCHTQMWYRTVPDRLKNQRCHLWTRFQSLDCLARRCCLCFLFPWWMLLEDIFHLAENQCIQDGRIVDVPVKHCSVSLSVNSWPLMDYVLLSWCHLPADHCVHMLSTHSLHVR